MHPLCRFTQVSNRYSSAALNRIQWTPALDAMNPNAPSPRMTLTTPEQGDTTIARGQPTVKPMPTGPGDVQVLSRLIESCLDAPLTLPQLAERLNCSTRTLQRRLARAATSYRALVDQSRYRTAIRRVSGSDDGLTRIAMDLGYLDCGSFTRAFRRWTGMAPRDFRSLIRDSDPDAHAARSPARRLQNQCIGV